MATRFRSEISGYGLSPGTLHTTGASTIYSAQRSLHKFYVHVAAFAVLYVTVDCNIGDSDCSNAAEIPLAMLLGDMCNTLLPIATVTRVCLRKPSQVLRNRKSHPIPILRAYYEFLGPNRSWDNCPRSPI